MQTGLFGLSGNGFGTSSSVITCSTTKETPQQYSGVVIKRRPRDVFPAQTTKQDLTTKDCPIGWAGSNYRLLNCDDRDRCPGGKEFGIATQHLNHQAGRLHIHLDITQRHIRSARSREHFVKMFCIPSSRIRYMQCLVRRPTVKVLEPRAHQTAPRSVPFLTPPASFPPPGQPPETVHTRPDVHPPGRLVPGIERKRTIREVESGNRDRAFRSRDESCASASASRCICSLPVSPLLQFKIPTCRLVRWHPLPLLSS